MNGAIIDGSWRRNKATFSDEFLVVEVGLDKRARPLLQHASNQRAQMISTKMS